ncbi:hypothetical protein ERUR111494_09330 [Erysipelothrix urinaevulpis]|uniref:hypothetical protein n=1 Tax=Erysipelothrix urinaevulpis TaxID=2683717 RepID=UPI001356A7CC|nr:hypothetical protein [Erysipelothrix urinaevulpis]
MENKKIKRGIYGVVASQVIMWFQLIVVDPFDNSIITIIGKGVMLYSIYTLSKTKIWNDKMKKSFILEVISYLIILLSLIISLRMVMKENIETLDTAALFLGLAFLIRGVLVIISSIFWFLGGEPKAVVKHKIYYIVGLIVAIIISLIGESIGSQVLMLVAKFIGIAISGLVLYVYLEYLKVIEPTIVEE